MEETSIWAIKGPGDIMEFEGISEIRVLSGTKRSDLVFIGVSRVAFYPASKVLEFITKEGKRNFVHGPFILCE